MEPRRICSTYSDVWWRNDRVEGDPDNYDEEHGWLDDEGETFAEMYWPLGGIDFYPKADHVADLSEGETAISLAVRFLQDNGAIGPSSSHWHGPGVWYSTVDPVFDREYLEDGRIREESYHLQGFAPEEERRIFELVTGRRIAA